MDETRVLCHEPESTSSLRDRLLSYKRDLLDADDTHLTELPPLRGCLSTQHLAKLLEALYCPPLQVHLSPDAKQ